MLQRVLRLRQTRVFSTLAPLDASKIEVSLTDAPTELPEDLSTLKFGHTFSDHMIEVDWCENEGWGAPSLHPFRNLSLHPAATSLHYGLECFEGLKAYRDDNGHLRLFRPIENAKRMRSSMERLMLPSFEEKEWVKLVHKLVAADSKFVPHKEGYSMYLRPTGISTQDTLGVGPARAAKLFFIASPVGPYYPTGFKAVRLLADSRYVRAWPGGTGDKKVGGNYAPCIKAQMDCAAQGYSQNLWLFGDEGYVTEAGTMNIFMHWINEEGEEELITPPLDGTILPGITRDSAITLCRESGRFSNVRERQFTMAQLAKAVEEGRVKEIFGCGTAAIVSPVKEVAWEGKSYQIPLDPSDPEAEAGPAAMFVWKSLTDIQYGRVDDAHGWSEIVEESL
ncbi:MAG: hypothetical protein MHM6MM_003579 [Cercozoa sp. M6MM]